MIPSPLPDFSVLVASTCLFTLLAGPLSVSRWLTSLAAKVELGSIKTLSVVGASFSPVAATSVGGNRKDPHKLSPKSCPRNNGNLACWQDLLGSFLNRQFTANDAVFDDFDNLMMMMMLMWFMMIMMVMMMMMMMMHEVADNHGDADHDDGGDDHHESADVVLMCQGLQGKSAQA